MIKEKNQSLLSKGRKALKSGWLPIGSVTSTVEKELYDEFKDESLLFIKQCYGRYHPFYHEFYENTIRRSVSNLKRAIFILERVEAHLEQTNVAQRLKSKLWYLLLAKTKVQYLKVKYGELEMEIGLNQKTGS